MDRGVGSRKGSWTALALAAALALGASTAPANAQTPSYSIVELAGVPQRINNNGQVAGWVYVGPDAHAAIYSNGAWRDLGVPAGDQLSTLLRHQQRGSGGRLLLRVAPRAGQPLAGDPRPGECHVGPGAERARAGLVRVRDQRQRRRRGLPQPLRRRLPRPAPRLPVRKRQRDRPARPAGDEPDHGLHLRARRQQHGRRRRRVPVVERPAARLHVPQRRRHAAGAELDGLPHQRQGRQQRWARSSARDASRASPRTTPSSTTSRPGRSRASASRRPAPTTAARTT